MAVRLKLVPIKVSKKFLNEKGQRRAVRNFMKMGAENIRIDFQVTVQTWKKNHPKFVVKVIDDSTRDIYTRNNIYKFVSGGTKVRYATMSKNWVSKTTPTIIGSGPGAGRKLYVNRNIPRPGIEARMFAKVIIEKWKARLPPLFSQEIHNEFQR